MEAQTKNAKKGTEKDVQTIITERIIGQLEKGIVPWRTPWMEAGVPTSLISKRPFRGINVLLLAVLGYERNVFLTSNQLEAIGGSIKPNERQNMIVFWNNQKGEPGDEKKTSSLLYYLVYNIAQCVGILGESVPEVFRETDPIKACEGIVANMQNGPSIRNKEAGAYYDPLDDYINVPKLKSFANPVCYYSALFHQLAHSTGHHTRLDRMGLVQMSEYGCTGFTQEYLDGWMRKLEADRYFIFTSCTLAQKAIDFILNVQDTKDDE